MVGAQFILKTLIALYNWGFPGDDTGRPARLDNNNGTTAPLPGRAETTALHDGREMRIYFYDLGAG